MKDLVMEMEDYVRLKDAEIMALREELGHERMKRMAAEREAEICFEAAQTTTRENVAMRKQLESWADDADELIARARRAELEALEL